MIIGISGRKQAGKDTVASYCANLYSSYGLSKKVNIYSFAFLLKKNICYDILGMTYEQCSGTDQEKNTFTKVQWKDVSKLLPQYSDRVGYMTGREVMEVVGTDIFRTIFPNVWPTATIKHILNDGPGLAIITDCRFPNEVEAIHNAGGKVIRLTRNPLNAQTEPERALDKDNFDWNLFDAVVDNQFMTIEEQNKVVFNTIESFFKC